AAMTGFIFGRSLMKRETKNAQLEMLRFTGQSLQFFRGQHALERGHQGWQLDGQRDMVQEPAQILHGERYALQKMLLALIKSAKSIRSEGLQNAYIHVSVIMLHECFAIEFYVTA